MKLATWNVNSLSVRLPQVLDWLQANTVDVLAMQELKMTDDKFPKDAFEALGYHAQWFGQKTYNGVALLSRKPAIDIVKNIPGFDDDMARVIAGTVDGVRVKFEYKMEWLKGMRQWIKAELEVHPKLVLMGDYNITFDDLDVWDPVGLHETIHCTEEERYHLRALVALGLHDSHRLFEQPAKSYSWWDYRGGGFTRNRGLRIDHILVSNVLKPAVQACAIDKLPRKNERPSDHAPVVVTLGTL
jgi:exodeoxyribonuclease-3